MAAKFEEPTDASDSSRSNQPDPENADIEPDTVDPDPVDADPVDAEQGNGDGAARKSRRPVRKATVDAGVVAASGAGRRRRSVESDSDDELESSEPSTKKRSSTVEEHHRTTPAQFVRESAGEIRKVVWPTREQMRGYFIVVLIFVCFVIAYVSLLDLGYGALLLRLLG